MEGRTSLVIAHRLSTVTHADIIFVVDNGHIVEQGDHGVDGKGGSYKVLYDMQFDDKSDPAKAAIRSRLSKFGSFRTSASSCC